MSDSINIRSIQQFFNQCAPTWDETSEHDTRLIDLILDHAGITAGMDVLDVACGTGILFPDYRRRQIGSLTAIDLSPEMLRRAAEKWPDGTFLCGDAACTDFGRQFDAIMIYNAFPHFLHPEQLLENLKRFLKPTGTLTIAHGMSRDALQRHHADHASAVSLELPTIEELSKLFSRYFTVECAISDDHMYELSGRNRL